jgi:hypothetical protein
VSEYFHSSAALPLVNSPLYEYTVGYVSIDVFFLYYYYCYYY